MTPLASMSLDDSWPTGAARHAAPCPVGGDQVKHGSHVHFGHLATRVRQRQQAHVQRAFAHRAVLRIGLHQGRARIDLELETAAGAFFHLLSELGDQAVAEIALVDGPAGKVVGNFDRFILCRRRGAAR